MEINILHLVDGARKAKGLTVIIDVFRAFSTACYVFHNGADKIHPAGSIETAFQLKDLHPDWLLMGEKDEQTIPGFHYGNSPTIVKDIDFTGKTVVQRTSAGTQGLVNATGADILVTGSFVNAGALVNFIRVTNPQLLSLVCMGYSAKYSIEEDTFCAEYIRNELEGKTNDFNQMKEIIRKTSAQRFFAPENQHFSPSTDFDLCLDLNRFDFVLKVELEEDKLLTMKKIDVSSYEGV
ncbi:MAG: 2-phosphosulfolactate phosphatase [Bacteroidales bacterium]|nr:2-phosphosulfolactate phosphatase [Bacteroidales bacterium]